MEEQNEKIIAQYLKTDAEILKENGLAPKGSSEQGGGSPKSKYWKFVGGFFALMLVGIIGIPMVAQYMEKQEDREREESAANYMQLMTDLQERLANDKDGGATPEETLKMFTDALKAGDIEQASKYFVFEPKERQKMLSGILEQLEKNGEMNKFVGHLEESKREEKDNFGGYVWFSNLGQNGKSDIAIEITKSKYSTVWKIENIAL